MSYTIILHISNEEAVAAEIDELPELDATMVMVKNPRRLDGKELHYLDESVDTVIWPLTRINFIEIMPSKEEEEIIGFVRE